MCQGRADKGLGTRVLMLARGVHQSFFLCIAVNLTPVCGC